MVYSSNWIYWRKNKTLSFIREQRALDTRWKVNLDTIDCKSLDLLESHPYLEY